MPSQIDKKKLLIGGGLLLILIIVIIAIIFFDKKSPQQHAADAKDSANMAIMHSNIAKAAANSPNNSAKDSTVMNAIIASNQAAAKANNSATKAGSGSAAATPAYIFPSQSVILNPTASGKYYITHGNKFLNTQNYNLEDTPKTPINFDITTAQATNPDGTPLTLYGQNVLIFPVKNENSVVTGIVINQVPTQQTYFPVSEDGTKITPGVYSFPQYDTGKSYPPTSSNYGLRAGNTIQGPNDVNLAKCDLFLFGLLPAS